MVPQSLGPFERCRGKHSAKSGGRDRSTTTISPLILTYSRSLTPVEFLRRLKLVPCRTKSPTNWARSRPYDFAGTLAAGFAAHTKTDMQKGEVHAIAYSPRQDYVQDVVIDKSGTVSRITDIPVRDKPMMHDFALTEKYVVLYDLPVTFSLDAAKAGKFPYAWNPADEAPAWDALSRADPSCGADWFPVEPCFVFHTLNAYDDGTGVCVDVCRYADRYDVSLMTGPGPSHSIDGSSIP